MRQSDIFSVLIIATVGTLASYFAVNALLGDPNMSSEQIKTIQEISPTLEQPDSELFNFSALNPTVEIIIDECQDINGNHILDYDELVKCGKVVEEKDDDQTLYTCPDGTKVTDISICAYLESQTPDNSDNPVVPVTPAAPETPEEE